MEPNENRENIRTCPICQQDIELSHFAYHLMITHSSTFITMLGLSLPELEPYMFMNLMNAYLDDYMDNLSYDELNDLCDSIGYHTVGFQDIHQVACSYNKIDTLEDSCPICLEPLDEKEIYKTIKCNHLFCKQCLTTWILSHKSCPMCQGDLTVEK